VSSAPRPVSPRVGRPERRLKVLLIGVLAVLSLFLGRLVQVQGLEAPALAADALSNRTVEARLPAARGDITDAEGVVLATTALRFDVTVDQTVVPAYTGRDGGPGGVRGAAEALAGALGVDVDDVEASLTGERRFAYVAKQVTPQVWRAVDALRVPGVYGARTSDRVYPAGPVAGNLIGFVGADGAPLAGLEMTRDPLLRGTDGSRAYERGADGRRIPTGGTTLVEPVPGGDVHLTIDRDLQWYAQQVVADRVAASGAEWGSAVVLDVRTGDLLALAEAPVVDPNDPADAPAEDRGTRALSDVIEPGSTAKVITAAAALEEGIVTPATRFEIPYRYTTANGQTFRDSHEHEMEKLTFAGVLGKSSNTGTVMVGEQLTRQQRHDWLTRFGMGQPTGLGFPGETRGVLHPVEAWDGRTEYAVLFGQGFSLNLVQAAQVFATIANDGVRRTPRLVAGTTDADGEYTPAPGSEATRVVSEQTARQVREMLEGAVGEEGTGQNAAVPGFRVAGKTGTAQAPRNGRYEGYTASFIGMAPAEDPRIVVAVTLQRPVNGFYGGTVAAPVFADVMAYALQARGVAPSQEPADLPPLTWE
jgi:cell division protein FtsI (penicillin-binding protein 3)